MDAALPTDPVAAALTETELVYAQQLALNNAPARIKAIAAVALQKRQDKDAADLAAWLADPANAGKQAAVQGDAAI